MHQCKENKPIQAYADREWKATRCKKCDYDYTTAWSHGITVEELAEYRKAEHCECCERRFEDLPERRNRKRVIDHDHETGKIRGVLCHNCNIAIGKAERTPELLGNMLAYLSGDVSDKITPSPDSF